MVKKTIISKDLEKNETACLFFIKYQAQKICFYYWSHVSAEILRRKYRK